MKKIVLEFVNRGSMACGLGPIVLAIIYLIIWQQDGIDSLTVKEVCFGIFSLSALAFIAGGMNVIYQIERIPLMLAILIHGGVLYISYLITYLFNGWLERGMMPILAFTCIFIFVYMIIWAVIYAIMKRRTERINVLLKRKQQS